MSLMLSTSFVRLKLQATLSCDLPERADTGCKRNGLIWILYQALSAQFRLIFPLQTLQSLQPFNLQPRPHARSCLYSSNDVNLHNILVGLHDDTRFALNMHVDAVVVIKSLMNHFVKALCGFSSSHATKPTRLNINHAKESFIIEEKD